MTEITPSEHEKIRLEHDAARLFMRWYERITGKEIRHIWHNKPTKPDVSCFLEGKRLDLEIAHLYGSEKEAMKILGRELSDETRYELHEQDFLTNADDRLVDALNRILENKSKKRYRTKQVWLVIRNAHPAWTRKQIMHLQHRIVVPPNHPFDQIWMVGDFDGKSGIVNLGNF